MSGIHGTSGTGSMSGSCSMKGMHDSSKVKVQQGVQAGTKNQIAVKQGKIPNQTLGNKIDTRV